MAACVAPDDVDEPNVVVVEQDIAEPNGISLNGISLNGISLNGTSLSGATVTGVSLSGTSSSGKAISANTGSTAQPLTGTTYVGAKFNATTSNGQTIALRIDAGAAGTGTSSDLWFYTVSYQSSSTTWSPLCGLDASNAPIKAVSVAGVWASSSTDAAKYLTSRSQFTFACQGKTIGKCVELGYKTFKGYANQMAACVRLLRGDFCGDGQAHTVDGTTLNLYDNVGVQLDTEAWKAEAGWDAAGAVCINTTNGTRWADAGTCSRPAKTATCGTSFTSGVLLISELP
ncbi:MAG TPA: ADYC domain-containing protein [Kofleriaceae bacterium]|nr:ADYC domain-containing protein [Kofleriaceae bacterium]